MLPITRFGLLVTALSGAMVLPGCGGGGGGSGGGESNFGGNLGDPVIPLVGNPGTLSQTPEQANTSNGTSPPPSYSAGVTTDNHWFRIEFPFVVNRATVLANDPLFGPFSFLNGNISVTDVNGEHIPGIAMVNGIDAQGVNRSSDVGFPHDPVDGVDRNLGTGVFLYVADVDEKLSTVAAWGFTLDANNQPRETQAATVDTVRVSVNNVNDVPIVAAWTFHVGAIGDVRPPFVVSVISEARDPTDPLNAASADSLSSFQLKFSEPMVPQSVGRSAELNGFPFDANLPLTPFTLPFPNSTIAATVATAAGSVFIPFDCVPINKNNLTTYRLRPLINLPPGSSVDVVERALTINTNGTTGVQDAAKDLSGNFFDGQDANNDNVPDGVNDTSSFSVGPGPAIVNIPVSPEVIYFTPASGDGIGAIDLNGWGIGTNAPGANAGIREKAIIITKTPFRTTGQAADPEPGSNPPLPRGLNLVSGIALIGHPGLIYNDYLYQVGTGSYPYGAAVTTDWKGRPNDGGNPGTPFPGVNEGSSGFESLCRDSSGSPILTGREFGSVGTVQDLIVGEFLDRVYFDQGNFRAVNAFHVSLFGGKASTQGRNLISDPPSPNPPPTRYWVGLPQIHVVLDQEHPTNPALLIEGNEVFTGSPRIVAPAASPDIGYDHLMVNPVNPNAPDQTIFPHFGVGPGPQSATQFYTFSARQQIGNFLYATDASSREVHAINSNTMRVISSISLPDPTGLAIAPDMEYLYVTNFSNDSMSVIVCDPTSANFHQEIARVTTGTGPRAIAVQPGNEDIFVCDYLGNTVSIIDPRTLTIRKQLDSLVNGPFDVEVTERQDQPQFPHPFGWACGIYFAYFTNFTGNSVLVYESGPDGAQGIGINNIRGSLPTTDAPDVFIAPRGLCFSPFANPQSFLAGGVFIAHQDEEGQGRVSQVQFTQQALYGPLVIQVPPGFFVPPGFTDRQFEVTSTWGNSDANRLAGRLPVDVSLADLNTASYQAKPSGAPNGGGVGVAPAPDQTGFVNSKNHMRLAPQSMAVAWQPDRLYVAFEDTDEIQVLDPAQAGVVIKTIPGHGSAGTRKLCSFWRQ